MVRGLAAAVALTSLSLTACKTVDRRQTTSAVKDQTAEANEAFSTLGQGFQSFTGLYLPEQCVVPNPDAKPPLAAAATAGRDPGARISWQMTRVSSTRELAQKMDLSLSASLKAQGLGGALFGGAELSDTLKLVRNTKFDDSHSYFLVKANVVRGTTSIGPSPRLTYPVFDRASMKPADFLSTLITTCGDMYLHSYTEGGAFYAVVVRSKSKTVDESKLRNQAEGSVTTKVGLEGYAAAKVQADFKSVVGDTSEDIQVVQIGGSEPIPPIPGATDECIGVDPARTTLDMAELELRLRCFPRFVIQNPVKLSAFYVDYTTLLTRALEGAPDRLVWIDQFGQNQLMLPGIAKQLVELSTMSEELATLDDAAAADAAKQQLELYNDKLYELLTACKTDFANCKLRPFIRQNATALADLKKRVAAVRYAHGARTQEIAPASTHDMCDVYRKGPRGEEIPLGRTAAQCQQDGCNQNPYECYCTRCPRPMLPNGAFSYCRSIFDCLEGTQTCDAQGYCVARRDLPAPGVTK